MSSRIKKVVLYGAVLATVVAAIFAPPEQETAEVSSVNSQQAMTMQKGRVVNLPVSVSSKLLPIKRSNLDDKPGDLFHLDKPMPTKAAKPEPPAAPPLPYVYMGKMIENGKLEIFLTLNNKPYVVHVGDILDNQYSVNSIQPQLIEFTYLPLKQIQTLSIGENK
ncbi:MAG: hypothetical protein LAC70_00255 [Methylovulum sp.]|nr:hypothetical protein [Methylovulum sp.]